jgi:Uma2 family endonuclease
VKCRISAGREAFTPPRFGTILGDVTSPQRQLTFEDYLEFEENSSVRHEFVAGEVYAMSGETRRHGRIVGNLLFHLRAAASAGRCEIYVNAIKLRVGDDVYYPDAIVTCSATDQDDRWVREPCLLIEVTSPSTARFDRLEKLNAYRKIPSLHAYLIVEQAWRRVVRHWRDASGVWQQEDLQGDGAIQLSCPEVVVTLDKIYEGLAPLTVKELEAIGYGVEP